MLSSGNKQIVNIIETRLETGNKTGYCLVTKTGYCLVTKTWLLSGNKNWLQTGNNNQLQEGNCLVTKEVTLVGYKKW